MIVTGDDKLKAQLEAIRQKRTVQFKKGLKLAGDHLLDKSHEIVPDDQDRLYDSGIVRGPEERNALVFTVTVGYAGPDFPDVQEYAVYVHEDTVVGSERYGTQPRTHGAAYTSRYLFQILTGMKDDWGHVFHTRRPQERKEFLREPLRTEEITISEIIRKETFK